MKESFLLVFAVWWIVFPYLPITFYRTGTGKPAEDHVARRAVAFAIGIALLVLSYSLQ